MASPESFDNALDAFAELLRAGSQGAELARAIDALSHPLGAFCQALLGDQSEVDHCLHDLFCALRDAMPGLTAERRRVLVYGTALSLCRRRIASRSEARNEAMLAPLARASAALPADRTEAARRAPEIRAALSAIKPLERDVAALRFVAGLDYDAIAEIVEASRGEAIKLAGRALLAVRQALLGATAQ